MKKYIYTLLFAASVFGLFLSMAHYHSEGLECIHHANEQHYTESIVTCPVCALHVQYEGDSAPSSDAFINFEEFIPSFDEALPQQIDFNSPLGRSPPFMA